MGTFPQIASIAVFAGVFAVIISGRVEKSKAAVFGAALILALRICTLEEAWTQYISFETLGLLLGMMTLTAIVKHTGVFEFIALKLDALTRGRYGLILVAFSAMTALISAFLDNVTTVLLIAPVAIETVRKIKKNPMPLLIAITMSSNIGGTATIIGDPPNVMLGSVLHKSFLDFLVNLGPVVLLVLVVNVLYVRLVFRGHFERGGGPPEALPEVSTEGVIRDRALLVKSLVVLGLTLVAFTLDQTLGVTPALISICAAALLAIISGVDTRKIIAHVEWSELLFFTGLFIIVGALEATGVIPALAKLVVAAGASPLLLTLIVLWASAIFSSLLNNIPMMAAMIPLLGGAINHLGLSATAAAPLWWALSLGACLGGNGTLIGASANVIVGDLSQGTESPLTFRSYTRVAFPGMLISIVVCSIYLWVRYYL